MNHPKIISFLRSSEFAIWVAILSMIVQSFHSFTAFYNTSSLQNYWGISQAILFAIVIDSAILFYTVRNRTDIAWGAAFVMVVINSYYYYQHLGLTFQFAFGVFLSLIIPVSVYFYSEEVGKENKKDDNDWREKFFESNIAFSDFQRKAHIELSRANQRIQELEAINNHSPEDKSLVDVQGQDPKEFDPDSIKAVEAIDTDFFPAPPAPPKQRSKATEIINTNKPLKS